MSHNNNKRGFSPTVIQDLRREFRIRSATKKNQQQQEAKASKPSNRSTPVRRKPSKQISTTSTNRENTPSKYQQNDNTASRYQIPKRRGSADKISICEEDQPTEFENDTKDSKPAKFARDWHKFPVPLDQLPSKGSNKKRSKSVEKKKVTRKVSQKRKSSTSNSPNVVADDHGKTSKVQETVSSKKHGRKLASDLPKKPEKRPAKLASQHKEIKNVDAPKRSKEKIKNSCETIEDIPLVSADEDEGDKTIRVPAKPEPKLVPAQEEDFKLKPLTDKVPLSPVITATSSSPSTPSASPTTSTVTHDEEFNTHDLEDGIERAPTMMIEPDRCGNSNFPVVLAAGRIIDYCDEKDLFKEFIEPSDLPIFNSFLSGEVVKSMPDLLNILEHLMDQIVDSKKLSETEATAKDWILISKDRIEGRNYLMDSFLAKKAKLNVKSGQALTTNKSTSGASQSPNTPSTNSATSNNSGDESQTCTTTSTNTTTTTTESTQPTLDPEERKDKNM